MSYLEQRSLTTICLAANGSRPPGGGVATRNLVDRFLNGDTSEQERSTILLALLLDVLRRLSYIHLGSYDVAAILAEQRTSARSVLADMIQAHESEMDAAAEARSGETEHERWLRIVWALVETLETDLRTDANDARRDALLESFE